MSDLAKKFELNLIYDLTDDGTIVSSLCATDEEAHTLYTERYSFEQTVEGYFWPIVDWSSSRPGASESPGQPGLEVQEGQITAHQTKALTSDKLNDGDWSSTLAPWATLRVNFVATIFEALRVAEN